MGEPPQPDGYRAGNFTAEDAENAEKGKSGLGDDRSLMAPGLEKWPHALRQAQGRHPDSTGS